MMKWLKRLWRMLNTRAYEVSSPEEKEEIERRIRLIEGRRSLVTGRQRFQEPTANGSKSGRS